MAVSRSFVYSCQRGNSFLFFNFFYVNILSLLQDAFGSERRKAKMLNFSIAYGKTPVGLSKDWKVLPKNKFHSKHRLVAN